MLLLIVNGVLLAEVEYTIENWNRMLPKVKEMNQYDRKRNQIPTAHIMLADKNVYAGGQEPLFTG